MKIRSRAELNSALAADLAARKRELTTMRAALASARPHEAAAFRRSSILLLYAHWEGFVKNAAECYLEFVSRQRLPYAALKTTFIALATRGAIIEAAASKLSRLHCEPLEFVRYGLAERSKIPTGIIDTKSNLSSDVLYDIAHTVGVLLPTAFDTKRLLLDASLLGLRNKIAHGEHVLVDEGTHDTVRDLVFELLDAFRDTIENAAALQEFLASS